VQELRQKLELAGANNPWVRRYVDLKSNRQVAPSSGAILESLGLIRAALKHDAVLEVLLVCPELLRSDRGLELIDASVRQGVRTLRVSERTFARLSSRDGPDGLAAIARWQPAVLSELSSFVLARVLVLDRFELPGNIGSLIRSAAAVSATAVVLTGPGARLTHPLIPKASVGAIFSVPTCHVSEAAALQWLRREGFEIVAADPAARRSYRDTTYAPRVAVVLGSERHGLSHMWRSSADQLVAIPMRGSVDSLNVGHAGALLLFEVAGRHGAL
jgi:RNA methyltransferase, TrmH family